MIKKKMILISLLVLSLYIWSACTTLTPQEEQITPEPTASSEEMTLAEAQMIAQNNTCAEVGKLSGTNFYNEDTGTWWLDLDAEKPGCSPACVVHVADRSAEVNWRCTGGLPPKEDEEGAEKPLVPAPSIAHQAVLTFLQDQYGDEAPAVDLTWLEENVTEAGLVGSTTYQYTAEDWMITVTYPLVNPASTIYTIDVIEAVSGFMWKGEVDAQGTVTEIEVQTGDILVSCWGGFVKSLSGEGQFDDYLSIDGEIGVGIEAADNTVAAQLQVVRDQDTLIHVWGKLVCPVIDYGGCQLIVSKIREDKPGSLPEPDVVEGWAGTVRGFAQGMQHKSYFELFGDFPVRFGIESTDVDVADQLNALIDSGDLVRVWGEVTCGVPSPGGASIMVTRVEVVKAP
jgi:hypothetical protein